MAQLGPTSPAIRPTRSLTRLLTPLSTNGPSMTGTVETASPTTLPRTATTHHTPSNVAGSPSAAATTTAVSALTVSLGESTRT